LGETLQNGNRSIVNLPCSGQPRTDTTECNDQKVDALIREDHWVMVREIIAQFGIGHNVVQEKILEYWKICHWFL
jgi:hypothetical protein